MLTIASLLFTLAALNRAISSAGYPPDPNDSDRLGGERHIDHPSHMFVYIIRSTMNGLEYVGMTANLDARLREHNAGRVRSTRSKRPWCRV